MLKKDLAGARDWIEKQKGSVKGIRERNSGLKNLLASISQPSTYSY